MGLLAVILCGTIGAQVVAPLLASRFIDQATSTGAPGDLTFLALLTIVLALAGRSGAERLCRAGLGQYAAYPRPCHTLLGRGAPGQRRFLWLPGRISGRAGGYPLQRGGRVCAAPLRRGDAVVAGREAQGGDEGLHDGRQQPGVVCAWHGGRLCRERLAVQGPLADHRQRLSDLPVYEDATPADRADPH